MRNALAAGAIALLAAGLPMGSVLAHPCPCFPPGAWTEAPLPAGLSGFSPQVATPVADGVLTLGVRGESAPLEAVLLVPLGQAGATNGDLVDVIPIDLSLPADGQLNFVTSNGSNNDVLMGGAVRPPGATGLGEPFFEFSTDAGRTWHDVSTDTLDLDLVIAGAPHAEGFAVSGSVERGGFFRPAVTVFNGQVFSPPIQLANREGFGIAVTTGPGDDTLTVAGVLVDDKDKQKPFVFTHSDEGTVRTSLPGGQGVFPTDVVTSGNDVVVTDNEGQVLHAAKPGSKFKPLKGLKGSMVHAYGDGLDPTLVAFGKNGPSFSFDGGDSWARTGQDGISSAGTVKATGTTLDGDFFAFSRGADDQGHLFLADGPPPPTVDPQIDFARMMAGFFVNDLVGAVGGVPTPEFVSEVTSQMHDVMAEYEADESLAYSDEPLTAPAEGATSREIAENFVARLVATGGSMPPAGFMSIATGEIHAAYDAAANATNATTE